MRSRECVLCVGLILYIFFFGHFSYFISAKFFKIILLLNSIIFASKFITKLSKSKQKSFIRNGSELAESLPGSTQRSPYPIRRRK